MTVNKKFERRVRAYAREHDISYVVARNIILKKDEKARAAKASRTQDDSR